MSERSPGPWVATPDGDVRFYDADAGCELSIIGDGQLCDPADAPLVAAAPEMLELLREVEVQRDCNYVACYICGLAEMRSPHRPDCKLAALLKRFAPQVPVSFAIAPEDAKVSIDAVTHTFEAFSDGQNTVAIVDGENDD